MGSPDQGIESVCIRPQEHRFQKAHECSEHFCHTRENHEGGPRHGVNAEEEPCDRHLCLLPPGRWSQPGEAFAVTTQAEQS